MSNLTVFDFNSNDIRVLTLDNEPWFVAMDVAGTLEYADPSMMLKLVDEDDKQTVNPQKLDNVILTETFGSNAFRVSVINESGLYACIFGSTKPQAKAFKKWVTSEVLPAIRKTGKYVIEQKPKTALELAREQVKLLETIEAQKERIEALEEDNEHLGEMVDELFEFSSIVRVAVFNDVDEKRFKWQDLKRVSRQMKLDIKRVPCPRFKYKLLYHHDVWAAVYPWAKLPGLSDAA